ncbi:formylglycine-generating enzyme family protein [Nitrospira sp. CMX1]
MQVTPWITVAAVFAGASCLMLSVETEALELDTVVISNTGNLPDARTGRGAVGYTYHITNTEVTNAQYASFLNAVDPTGSNPHDVYNPSMSNSTGFAVVKGGIDLTPTASDGTKYSAKPNYGDKPVNYVTFHDAARFANWAMTGDTENGFYVFNGTDTIASQGIHGADPHHRTNWVALPTEDEWYKAAYHKNDGPTGNYFLYPTSSDSVPTVAVATPTGDIANPGANVANYNFGANWDDTGTLGHVTTVGSAGPESASPYGTSDQGGNIYEWTETPSGSNRIIRGGSLWLEEHTLRSTSSSVHNPLTQGSSLGFRLVSLGPINVVPLPTAAWLFGSSLVGLIGFVCRRRTMTA